MAIYRLYAEPYKADVTLVVGGWTLLNLIMAGCALGVVSERGERSSSRRVRVNRRCEFGVEDRWYPASIEDVSVHGARLHVFSKTFDPLAIDSPATIKFRPYSGANEETLVVTVRNTQASGEITAIGCLYNPQSAVDHRLIADLMFANSDQWTQFQLSRRHNPGLIKGTIWFLGVAAYQTSRGLVYFFRSLKGKQEEPLQPAKAGAK
jgi:cellulose synthase (UDP-forming)